MVSVHDAVRDAIATDEGPVVLGDLADSGGAGTPGDGTAILAELLKQNARGAVIGNIADPDAVQEAIAAGVGKQVTLTVGGKVDRFHGEPVAISGRVRVIHDGVYSASTRFNFGTYHRGPTVVVDCGGTEVILTARPCLVFEPNHFRSLGIEPARAQDPGVQGRAAASRRHGRCRAHLYRCRRAGTGHPGFEPACPSQRFAARSSRSTISDALA